MRQPLSIALPLHWMLVFGLLAALCTEQGFSQLVLFITGKSVDLGAMSVELSAGFGVVFALNATLFLWYLLTRFLAKGDQASNELDEVAGIAFASSILTMSSVIVVALWLPGQMLVAASVLTAALAASYASIASERSSVESTSDRMTDEEIIQAGIKRMALGAAHMSLLPRLSRRDINEGGAA